MQSDDISWPEYLHINVRSTTEGALDLDNMVRRAADAVISMDNSCEMMGKRRLPFLIDTYIEMELSDLSCYQSH
jgi:hypothetical protein